MCTESRCVAVKELVEDTRTDLFPVITSLVLSLLHVRASVSRDAATSSHMLCKQKQHLLSLGSINISYIKFGLELDLKE